MRGWPLATIAFYGPDASRATKVMVCVIPSKDAEPSELDHGDVRKKPEMWKRQKRQQNATGAS